MLTRIFSILAVLAAVVSQPAFARAEIVLPDLTGRENFSYCVAPDGDHEIYNVTVVDRQRPIWEYILWRETSGDQGETWSDSIELTLDGIEARGSLEIPRCSEDGNVYITSNGDIFLCSRTEFDSGFSCNNPAVIGDVDLTFVMREGFFLYLNDDGVLSWDHGESTLLLVDNAQVDYGSTVYAHGKLWYTNNNTWRIHTKPWTGNPRDAPSGQVQDAPFADHNRHERSVDVLPDGKIAYVSYGVDPQDYGIRVWTPPPPDGDGDGVTDAEDNCPNAANANQVDLDEDGLGDACDDDADGDGHNVPADCNDRNPDVHPGAEEICDGTDWDCDGDRGGAGGIRLTRSCVSRDGCEGVEECTIGGRWGRFCNAPQPFPEVCDDLDNDCDGETDEGGICNAPPPDSDDDGVPDDGDNCPQVVNADQADLDGDGEGDACDDDADGDEFPNCEGHFACDCDDLNAEVNIDAEEVCDGLDQNCNGRIDEDDVCCMPSEVCDGADNDCDGQTDEDGVCCAPSPEICDGLDNDCDGQTDEGVRNACGGCEPLPEDRPLNGECSVGIGSCRGQGNWRCSGPDAVECSAQAGEPSPEVCDLADNDCDGETDEDGVCDPVEGEGEGPTEGEGEGPTEGEGEGPTEGEGEGPTEGEGEGEGGESCPEPETFVECHLPGDECPGGRGLARCNRDSRLEACECLCRTYDEDSVSCDADDDVDGVPFGIDNCPDVANADQADLDVDGQGDVCDEDPDGDGYFFPDDCDETNPGIHPRVGDGCDGIDNDCDGETDEGCDPSPDAGEGEGDAPVPSKDNDDGGGWCAAVPPGGGSGTENLASILWVMAILGAAKRRRRR